MDSLKKMANDSRTQLIFLFVFAIGIFVHGSRFFNVHLSHDDLVMTGAGTTYTSGRWFLQILFELEKAILGSHINAKGFIAILSFLSISIICCIIAFYLDIKRIENLVLLSGLVVTFPYVTSLFGYTYTADYYYVSIIMSMSAAVLIYAIAGWKRYIFSVVLLGLSMGIYQTALCIFVAFLSILAIKLSMSTKAETWTQFITRCMRYISVCGCGCLFYLASNKIVLHIKGLEMSDYKGLNNMTQFTIVQLLSRVKMAYKEFLLPSIDESYSLFWVNSIRWCYRAALLLIFLFSINSIICAVKDKAWKRAIQFLILYTIAPIAINSVFLTADVSTTIIYSLMMFSSIMIFIWLIYISEYTRQKNCTKPWKVYGMLATLVLIYCSIFFGYTANICYTKVAIQQEQTIGYFNRMIARIQSTNGYKDELPIAYINGRQKNEENLKLPEFENLYKIHPYNNPTLINLYNWERYMSLWCGFAPKQVSEDELKNLENLPQIQGMPCYPDDGSIIILDEVIVIKFADSQL